MAKQNLENGATFGTQRQKINENFTEVYDEIANIQLIPGPKGDQGEQGSQGIQGPKGDKGDPGTFDLPIDINADTEGVLNEDRLPSFTADDISAIFDMAYFEIVNGKIRTKGSVSPSLTQTIVTFGTSTATQNVINWAAVTSATLYVVQRSLNSNMSSPTTIYTGSLLTYTDTGLTASTTYYYTVTASATNYISSVSDIASKATAAASSGATPLTNFKTSGVTINSNNATSTAVNAGCVASKSTDTTVSTLALKSFEIGWDASWVGKDIAFGLGTPDYEGASLNAIENAFYIGPSGAIEGKTGGNTSSLGYTLPQATTTKLRVRVVEDTTNWKVFFERSIDSGTNWTLLNSGGTLSTVVKTAALHGCIFMFQSGVTVNSIKGDA